MKFALPAILGLLAVHLGRGWEKTAEKASKTVAEPAQEAQPISTVVKANEQNTPVQKQKAIIDIPIEKLGREFRIIGEIGRPLGELVTVQGFIVDGPGKGYDDGANIVFQKINGRASQEAIQLKVRSLGAGFADHEPEVGKTYELRGYEEGGYVGIPAAVFKGGFWGVQCSDFYFHTNFVAIKSREIPAIEFSPVDFQDRFAVLEGEARSQEGRGYLVGKDWTLLVLSQTCWPSHVECKRVEVDGVMRGIDQIKKSYRAEASNWRLVRLKDQVGCKVQLKGRAWSQNGHWWFRYRDTDLYVEKLDKMPGWSSEQHGESLIITGTLGEELLPRIDQLTLKAKPDLQEYFIVREAAWKPIPAVSGR